MIDLSGSITAGGVAQTLATTKTVRDGFMLENLSVGDIYVRFAATAAAAAGSIRVPSGQLYETPPRSGPNGAISVFGATTGQAFTAAEW